VLNSSLLASCDVLVPNEQEVLNLGRSVPAILASGVGAVVITRGGEGAEVFVGREEPRLVPAPAVAVRDTTGAGDVFAAALAVALQEGAALLAACRFAVAAGSLATTGLGARGSLPSRFSIEEMLTEKGLY
jgi:ribokinase